jgi:CSLREA domain-containing protein
MTIRSFHRARAQRLDRAARRANRLARRGRVLAGATLGATTLLVANAQAADYTVTTNADSNDGACTVALCSLRDAINAANGDSSSDTITFASGVTGEIDLGSTLQVTTANGLSIKGPGSDVLTISGQGTSQILDFSPSVSTYNDPNPNVVSRLTLTDGSTTNAGGAVEGDTFQPLVLVHDVITNSTSTNTSSTGGGGGVFAEGATQIVSSTISGNTAAHGGGVEINPKYASYSVPKYGLPLVIKDSTISGNHAVSHTGSNPTPFGGGGGVAAYGSQVLVRDSTLSGNTSVKSGGGITDLSKYGIQLTGSKVTGNHATYNGGGIMDEGFLIGRKYDPTEISTSTISGNTAHSGAGLAVAQYNYGPGGHNFGSPGQPVTIDSSTISGNRGTDAAPSAHSPHSFGGGIEVFGSLASPFRLVNSTVSGNGADKGGGISLGGAYYLPVFAPAPVTNKTGSVSLENSTIAGNNAHLAYAGGGIYLGSYTTSGPTKQSGTAAIESTIVSGNKAHGKPNDLRRSGGATTGGFTADFSLIQHPGAAPLTGSHLIVNRNPGLGALQNNGGPTQTKLPYPKSPVIDQGHASLGDPTDQRGDPRTVDTAVPNPSGGDGTDIGAVELSSGQVAPARDTGFSADVGGQRLGGASTPLLIAGVTPVSCRVRVGPLGSCQLEVVVQGRRVAAGGAPANGSAKRLTTTVRSSKAAQRYLLKHYPLGLVASARASGLAVGPASALGSVRLLGGPSITLGLGTGSTKFSQKVRRELGQAARLLAGTRRVTVTGRSSSQAGAVSRRLTRDGVRAPVRARTSRHAPPNQITITFSY